MVVKMRIIKNKLKSELNLRTEKDFPVKGIEFIDINPLAIQKDTFNEIIDKFVEEISTKNIDYIVGPEARGFIFGSAVANQLNIGFLPVRKKGKMPPSTVAVKFEYEKEYGKDVLELPKLVNEDYTNKNFYSKVTKELSIIGTTIQSFIIGLMDDIEKTVDSTKFIENLRNQLT